MKKGLIKFLSRWLNYAEAYSELAGPIAGSLRLVNTALSRKCCSGGGLLTRLFDLTGTRIEHKTFCSKSECAYCFTNDDSACCDTNSKTISAPLRFIYRY